MAEAWQEANKWAGQPGSHVWSHLAVYMAGKIAGWHELRTQLTAQEQRDVKVRFANAYQKLVNEAVQGNPLEPHKAIERQFDPTIHSEQLHRETMEAQGIDPLDGAGARDKLKGMF